MSYSTSTNDDYNNDIKPDQSCPALNDSISDIAWITNQVASIFAATCWDGQFRIYQASQGQFGASLTSKVNTKINSPLTACCWSNDNSAVYIGCGDGSIKALDVNSQNVIDIGRANAGISSLHCIQSQNIIISTGYENNVHFWQPGNNSPVFSSNCENKIYCADFKENLLVAGCSNQKIAILDLSNINNKPIIQDSLDLGKHSQIQSIALNHKGNTLGMGSIDGRANISTVTKNQTGSYQIKSLITFKSNKQQQGGGTILYPVNSVDFNVVSDKWFLTAGSEGAMSLWDYEAKNKIKPLNYGNNPICKAKVSPRGDMIAYGLGNDWHMGVLGNGLWQPKVGLHIITQQETKFNFGK